MSAPLLCDIQTLADGVSSPNPDPLSVTLTGCSGRFLPLKLICMAVE